MCQVVLFACWITPLNQDIFKSLMKEIIWGILNRSKAILIATFLVILSGSAFHKILKK